MVNIHIYIKIIKFYKAPPNAGKLLPVRELISSFTSL